MSHPESLGTAYEDILRRGPPLAVSSAFEVSFLWGQGNFVRGEFDVRGASFPLAGHWLDAHDVSRRVLMVLLKSDCLLHRQAYQNPPANRANELDAWRRPGLLVPSEPSPFES